jgi:hypothetical protein
MLVPTFFTSSANANNAASNAAGANANQAASARQAASSHTATANATAAQTAFNQAATTSSADRVANQFNDASHSLTANTLHEDSLLSNQRHLNTAAQQTAAAANTSAASADNLTSSSGSTANFANKASASHQSASSLVMNNLDSLRSQHMLLQVNMTTNQNNNLLRVFMGNSGTVSSSSNFPFVTAGCGAVVTPVVAAPVVGVGAVVDPPGKEPVATQHAALPPAVIRKEVND